MARHPNGKRASARSAACMHRQIAAALPTSAYPRPAVSYGPFRTKMQDRSDIAQWPFKRIPREPGATRSASFDEFVIVRLRRQRITIDWASMGDRSRPQNAAFGIDPAITGCGTEPPRSSRSSAASVGARGGLTSSAVLSAGLLAGRMSR